MSEYLDMGKAVPEAAVEPEDQDAATDASLRRRLRELVAQGEFDTVLSSIARYEGVLEPAVWSTGERVAGDTEYTDLVISAADTAGHTLLAKDVEEALLLRAIEAGSTSALVNLGHLYRQTGRLTEAETQYQGAANRGLLAGRRNRALLLKDMGRYQEATTELRTLVDLGDRHLLPQLGEALINNGDLAAGEREIRRALDEGVDGASSHLGHSLWKQGRIDEAERVFQAALEQGDESVLFDYALMLSELPGRQSESIDLYRRAPDLEAHRNVAITLWELGRLDEAEAAFKESLARGDHDTYKTYADFLDDRGDLHRAAQVRAEGQAAEADRLGPHL